MTLGIGLDGGVESGVLETCADGEEQLEDTGDQYDEEKEGEEGQRWNGGKETETSPATIPVVFIQKLFTISWINQ